MSFPLIKNKIIMSPIEILVFLASLCLPIWMGDVWDYVHNIEDLFEVLNEDEEILQCLVAMGYSIS
jgi:hypothetical protein